MASLPQNNTKILTGMQSIMDYIGVGKSAFYNLVKMGLPATVIDNRWYAHKDNLDLFFQKVTRNRIKEIPDDAEWSIGADLCVRPIGAHIGSDTQVRPLYPSQWSAPTAPQIPFQYPYWLIWYLFILPINKIN